ncbi:microfibril-associated glycoprotein 4-like [Dendronephthya gigantea]|uniref:microfibril-associated glycoprotein 4-like n=1 Tax=Dendronephthya gigantea TaxID=151771 RepID=UPI0010694B1A|nr:microfibril-associated glycoprotein 4-like [Dendronephthya gigantea]
MYLAIDLRFLINLVARSIFWVAIQHIKFSEGLDFCFNSSLEGYKLDARILKTQHASTWINCVIECAKEPCCRSINYNKTFDLCEEPNCEMLHNLAYNTSDKILQLNPSFDHIYLAQPEKDFRASCITGLNCADFYEKGNKQSGIYEVDPDGRGNFKVFCDMTTSGGGWTVFQRRLDGSVDFYRGWQDYKQGFGNLSGEYWLGLEKIHRMTNILENELRIDMEDTSGNTRYAHYDYFTVDSEIKKFRLFIGAFEGTAGNSLSYHNHMAFSTKDSENDVDSKRNCAVTYKAAWWYRHCHQSNLNGLYLYGKHTSHANGVNWKHWKGYRYSLKSTSMKIRPRVV